MADRKEPKTMSSRLLTMKFMQRGAVKNSSPTSSTGPSTPTSNGPPSKRQRMSSGSYTPTPSSDYDAMQAALAAEEAKRAIAIERQAAEAGETRWVLSFKDAQAARGKAQMRVVQAGFAEIDGAGGEESSEEETGVGAVRGMGGGRVTFGKSKVEAPKAGAENASSDLESDSESSDSDSDSDSDPNADPTDALIRSAQARADRQAKKQAARAEAVKMAEKRRRKGVNLNENKGSDKSAYRRSMGTDLRGMKCYACNQLGHKSADCPTKSSRRAPKDHWDGSGDLKIIR